MNNLPWNLIRSFLAVARCGSLSAAAKELEVSQPTVSRDIQAIEKLTSLNLFQRTTQGLNLTDAGKALVESATRMDAAAELFNRQASGLSTELKGDIRISANEIVGVYLLPAAVTEFRRKHPGVQVEILITNQASSLNKREADIALRMFRPTQPDLVARRLPDMQLGFYAHMDYLKQCGEPQSIEEFKKHNVIGFDNDREFIDAAGEMGIQFTPEDFVLRTDSMLMQINLARAGGGIIGTHTRLAERWPELTRIMHWIPLPMLEFWVVCHSDTQFNSRIRAMQQFLIEWYQEDSYRGLLL